MSSSPRHGKSQWATIVICVFCCDGLTDRSACAAVPCQSPLDKMLPYWMGGGGRGGGREGIKGLSRDTWLGAGILPPCAHAFAHLHQKVRRHVCRIKFSCRKAFVKSSVIILCLSTKSVSSTACASTHKPHACQQRTYRGNHIISVPANAEARTDQSRPYLLSIVSVYHLTPMDLEFLRDCEVLLRRLGAW